MKKLLAFGKHQPDTGALSALLDARLDAAGAAALETHVGACDACRARLAELRAVRDSLRAIPATEARRSFRLRAADVERAAPVTATGGFAWALPLVSAAAAVAFVILVGAAVYANSGGSSVSRSSLDAYSSQQSKTEAQPAAPAAADASAADSTAKRSTATQAAHESGPAGEEAPTTAQGALAPAPSDAGAAAPGAASPTAPTAAAYSDSAAPSGGGGGNHADLWWYAAAAAGIVAATTAGAALYARRKRGGI